MGLIPGWGSHKLSENKQIQSKKNFNVKIKENNLLDDYNIQISEMNDSNVIRNEREELRLVFKKY